MTVQELIVQLLTLNPDAEVHFAYNYGDHWHTQVAPKVEEVSMGIVQYSDYHGMDRLMDEDGMNEDEGDFEGTRSAVIIS